MTIEWKEKKLEEVTSYISKGITPKYIEKQTSNSIRVLNQKCNKNYEISYDFSRLHDLQQKKVPEEKILQFGDVIINSTGEGTAGRIAQIWELKMPTTLDGHMILLRPTHEIDLVFYGYSIKSRQKQIELLAEGSTGQTEINRSRLLNEILIKYPSDIKEQVKIGNILKSIDEKIINNKRINNNLLEQAKTLYKQFFIDNIQKSSWKLGKVEDIIVLHDSKRIPLSSREREQMNKTYPYYGATSLMDYVENYIFDGIYLLLGEDGTVIDNKGYPVLQYVYGKFWVNNHAHIITGKNGFSVEELYLLFSMTSVKSIVTGAVQPKISQINLKNLPIRIPPLDLLETFNEIIQPMFAKIRTNRNEIDNLQQLRDTLLPKLMSSELNVSEIDI